MLIRFPGLEPPYKARVLELFQEAMLYFLPSQHDFFQGKFYLLSASDFLKVKSLDFSLKVAMMIYLWFAKTTLPPQLAHSQRGMGVRE